MWMVENLLKCPHCGTRLEEWDPKKGGDLHAYVPQVYTCPGCELSGPALEAHQKSKKASGGGHGSRVRMIPRFVVDYQAKRRTPEERERMRRMERERQELERTGNVDVPREPRNARGLGASRRPPPIDMGNKALSEGPPKETE